MKIFGMEVKADDRMPETMFALVNPRTAQIVLSREATPSETPQLDAFAADILSRSVDQ